MRAVVDTNILVRAMLKPQGTVGPVLGRLRNAEYTLLYSTGTLTELIDVLNRPRIRRKYGLTSAEIETVLALILMRGENVSPVTTVSACRDPKDNEFLAVAISGHADVIVTGDEDLLVLHPFVGIPILTPRLFLQRMGQT